MELPRLPIDRYRVALRLTRTARFRFHHGSAVREALARALGVAGLPPGVVPCAPESGRVTFAAGDRYRLGVTLVGEERRHGAALAAGLAAIGERSRAAAEGPPAGLAGGFAVEAVEPLPPVALEDELAALAEPPAIT
ncbi:MAG TPA: hypothetical protein VHM02_00410, partial [Thermoanaerobaculia bacterium]|nr:hypothetical protein [Thermoanaerobaculia bacterium]